MRVIFIISGRRRTSIVWASRAAPTSRPNCWPRTRRATRMIMGSHLSLAEPFRERDSFQVANAASAPNAGVHRLTGARHLPSRRRVTASWRSPGRTRGCIGSLAPSFCPAARVTASWRSPAFVHLRARRVRRWCSIAWCLFGWSLVLLDLRAYGSMLRAVTCRRLAAARLRPPFF